jgi:MFS family permease
MSGALVAFGIFIFAVGEMMSSPKKMEYLSEIAPPDKKGLYMGYANVPLAIGWGIGSSLGGYMYQHFGDKVTLAKQYMATKLNMSPETLDALPKDQVMTTLAAQLGKTPREATELLFAVYQPQQIWYVFGAIGLASMIGLIIYDRVITHRDARKAAA